MRSERRSVSIILALMMRSKTLYHLQLEGIRRDKVCDEDDPLIKRAISAYVKAEFGLDNADAPKYRESYEMLKRKLTLSDEYLETREE